MKKLYDPETGKFDPTPIEDFCMWTALKRGGDKVNIQLLKEFVYQWVQATVQKTSGQRERGNDIDPETGVEIHRCACCASPKLDDVTMANDSCEYGKGEECQNAV